MIGENVSFAELFPMASINNTHTCPDTEVGRTQTSLKDKDLETVSSQWTLKIPIWAHAIFLYIPSAAQLSSLSLALFMMKNTLQNFLLCFKELTQDQLKVFDFANMNKRVTSVQQAAPVAESCQMTASYTLVSLSSEGLKSNHSKDTKQCFA